MPAASSVERPRFIVLVDLATLSSCSISFRCARQMCGRKTGGETLHVYTNPRVVHYLLSRFDTAVSIKGSQGMTPLHHACGYGWTGIVKYLIEEKRCDPQCCQDDGLTPLHFACDEKQVEVVEYLLSTGKVDPMAKSVSGILPLELAGRNL